MKKFLSLVLALVMTMSLVTVSAGAKSFTDDSKIAYKEAVDVVSELKIVDGYADGAFNPTNTLTRGAAAKIICNLILGPTTAGALSADAAPYKDVPTDNTFAGYIAYCSQQGIISGYADGTFRPAATLTGYAFMKMLLGALGYDAAQEGFVGANWSVQVGKLALGIGLDDGNDAFVGTKAVTREEACLYAFNTLTATMVEYENQSSIIIGDITVNTSSKAKDMANTSKTDGNIDNDDKMQFAEKFFSDLKMKGGSDDFARPANVWTLKSNEIGTYAKTADVSYTAKVEVGDIYKDLGLSSTIAKEDVSVYVDGVADAKQAPVAFKKGDDVNKYGDNGVLTEVFYDDDDGTIIVTEVNTYVGKINRSVSASGNKEAYVEVTVEEAKPEGASGTLKFETEEEYEDDAVVLYTYSRDAKEIKSIAIPETVEGTVTKVVVGKSIDVDGTTYKTAAKLTGDTASVKNDYTVILDAYGYAIFVEEDEYVSGDYALLLATQDKGDFSNNRARLLFTDGSEKVVDTAKNYKTGSNAIDNYTIVTYKEDEDGEYTLKKVAKTQTTNSAAFVMSNGTSKVTTGGTGENAATIYTTSKTVVVMEDGDDYNSYTGTNSAPSVKGVSGKGAAGQVEAYWYCKTSTTATVMFIMPGSAVTVETGKNTMLFVAGESVSKLTHTKDSDYYQYNAVVNGEITTIQVDDGVKNAGKLGNGIYKSASYDKYDVITKLNVYETSGDKYADSAKGTDKKSGEYTVLLGDEWYTVADKASIYEVDEDGNITAGGIGSISKDKNDIAYFIVDDGQVTYLFIQEVADDAEEEEIPELSKDIKVRSVDYDNAEITYYVAAGEKALTNADINAILKDDGCTNVSINKANEWSYTTKDGLGYEGVTITKTQVYKVVVDSNDAVYLEEGETIKSASGDLNTLKGTNASADGGENFVEVTTGFTVAKKDLTIASGYYKVTTANLDTISDITNSTVTYTVDGDTVAKNTDAFAKKDAEIVVTVSLVDGFTTGKADATLTVADSVAAIDYYATLADADAKVETAADDTITFPTNGKLYKVGVYTFTLKVAADDVTVGEAALTNS